MFFCLLACCLGFSLLLCACICCIIALTIAVFTSLPSFHSGCAHHLHDWYAHHYHTTVVALRVNYHTLTNYHAHHKHVVLTNVMSHSTTYGVHNHHAMLTSYMHIITNRLPPSPPLPKTATNNLGFHAMSMGMHSIHFVVHTIAKQIHIKLSYLKLLNNQVRSP